MLSLSPALPPAALRVPESTTTPAAPGDFAAALAGLLVAPGAIAVPPVAPADRQIAAMPGKDLPADAVAAGTLDTAPETGILADEAVAGEAMPHPVEEPQPPVLPTPTAPTVAPPVDAAHGDETPPPSLPEALPTPHVVPAPAPAPAADAATPPGTRARARKDRIAALPLPIPGTAALAPSVTESPSIPAVPITADGAPSDDGSAAKADTRVPTPNALPHGAVPVALDTSPAIPADVTDSGSSKVTDDDRVAIDAPGRPAIADSAIPLVALPTITTTLDGAAPPPAGKAPPRPPRFAAPIAIEPSQTPARATDDATASPPLDGAKTLFARASAPDSARPTPAIAPDSTVSPMARGPARAVPAPVVVTQAPPLAPGAGAIPIAVASAAVRPAAPRRPIVEAAEAPLEPSIPGVAGHAASPVAAAPAPAFAIHRTPLDMRRDDWTRQLIDRIETVRDMANAADTRIKLVPDALGKIDVAMRKDGDTMHVSFTADVAATRAMLAEAQPRLAELAQQRGLRLGQSSVDAGAGGHGQPHQSHQPGASHAPLPSRPMRAEHDDDLLPTGRLA